ncbi:CHASE3 domain-containing protein [Flavobacterium crassostreae]|uniref:CHASE3 domain-containing protein n=1 Tax=Flavobacterium crassostreae TaxID=1763534 RepID=A0A1B9DYQ8_9FLAO|nr:CHASE3 domain-containing protein [Flavobacterium crassostreae]OCB74833.1 hypothetical protein LPBF_09470 [Flavobacterium crassostreae]
MKNNFKRNLYLSSAISLAAMRGFLITGREDFLNHFDQSEEEAHAAFDKVQQLTVDNPVQQRSLMELKPVRTKLFQFLRYRISEK